MGKMTGCDDCFYFQKDEEEFPCNMCKGYSYYLHKDVYKEDTDNKAWARIVEGLNGTSEEDMWPKFEGRVVGFNDYDTVNKPKHYMLFEEQGIEVRDVIEKLLDKLADNPKAEFYSYQFASDYVQMMQYLMRFMDKGGVEDLKKAEFYLKKLIEAY